MLQASGDGDGVGDTEEAVAVRSVGRDLRPVMEGVWGRLEMVSAGDIVGGVEMCSI